jgi:hypothetical protein
VTDVLTGGGICDRCTDRSNRRRQKSAQSNVSYFVSFNKHLSGQINDAEIGRACSTHQKNKTAKT